MFLITIVRIKIIKSFEPFPERVLAPLQRRGVGGEVNPNAGTVSILFPTTLFFKYNSHISYNDYITMLSNCFKKFSSTSAPIPIVSGNSTQKLL